MAGVLAAQGRYLAAIICGGMREVMATLMLVSLLSCAASPVGYLVPVTGDIGETSIQLLAVTTRAPSEKEGIAFGGDRGDVVSFRTSSFPFLPAANQAQYGGPGSAPVIRNPTSL
jgi:hypothetical protein